MVRFRFLDAIFELRKALWSLAGFTFQFFNISTTMSETAEKTENNEKESQENGESTFVASNLCLLRRFLRTKRAVEWICTLQFFIRAFPSVIIEN